MTALAVCGWLAATAAVAVAWRLGGRLRAVRTAGLEAVAEAMSWRQRAAEEAEAARLARAEAESVRASYAKVIGRARTYRRGQYPHPTPPPTE